MLWKFNFQVTKIHIIITHLNSVNNFHDVLKVFFSQVVLHQEVVRMVLEFVASVSYFCLVFQKTHYIRDGIHKTS